MQERHRRGTWKVDSNEHFLVCLHEVFIEHLLLSYLCIDSSSLLDGSVGSIYISFSEGITFVMSY